MFGTVLGGYYLAREALHAADGKRIQPDDWLDAKIDTATFYAARLLPRAAALAPSVTAGATSLFAVGVEHFPGS
jgi:hypothetical protein